MAVIGLGIDVVPVERVRKMIERHGDRILQRIFTPQERELAKDLAHQALHLAGRIAAKEATYKALSTGGADLGIGWLHLEVEKLPDGRPQMILHGPALDRFNALGANHCYISLSHDGGIAAAVVILE
ncbi:MAG: holo-ACP synthase [Gemmatimonadales bacterium]|nr:holo-ACP synthase [Gemmatimonadales bacterium]